MNNRKKKLERERERSVEQVFAKNLINGEKDLFMMKRKSIPTNV
jgi:hypothetical protein